MESSRIPGGSLNDSYNRSPVRNNNIIRCLHSSFILHCIAVAKRSFTNKPQPFSFTTLQALDSNFELSRVAFDTNNLTAWSGLQVALSASLPSQVVYNLTVYDVNDAEGQLYNYVNSISNAESLGTSNAVSTYAVGSSNVTFNFTPQKIGEEGNGGTLYILNCSDANGWWITGYTAQNLAQDLYNLLSPYFI